MIEIKEEIEEIELQKELQVIKIKENEEKRKDYYYKLR